jgi:hypothetical protein
MRTPQSPSKISRQPKSVHNPFQATAGAVGSNFRLKTALLALGTTLLIKSLGSTKNMQYAQIGERVRRTANSASSMLS